MTTVNRKRGVAAQTPYLRLVPKPKAKYRLCEATRAAIADYCERDRLAAMKAEVVADYAGGW